MNKKIRIALFCLFMGVMIFITIYAFPYILRLGDEQSRIEIQNKISDMGFLGWLVMLNIQIAQVVIAFLPGEPVEIIMGIMYGPIIGTLTCLLGIAIGTVIIYVLSKWIGKPFISLFVDPDKLDDFKFINNKQKKDITVFTLFFIPGTPKDLITYFAPFVKMNFFRFLIISLFARIPSIVTSTIGGTSIISGNWTLTVIIFSVTLMFAIIGYFINKHFIGKNRKY